MPASFDIGPWAPGDLRPYGYTISHARASVGLGWETLVTALIQRLNRLCRDQVLAGVPHASNLALIYRVGVADGQLCISVPTVSADALRVLYAAAQLSQQICERCGKIGRSVRQVPIGGRTVERHILCPACDHAYNGQGDGAWRPEERWPRHPSRAALERNPSPFPPGWGPLGRDIERRSMQDLGGDAGAAPEAKWQPNPDQWSLSAEDRPWRPGVDDDDDRAEGLEKEPWQG